MTVERALEVLGLAGEAPEKDVRRAYLRQVKAHPPERDPDGFRQVREAYELLKDGYWLAPPGYAEERRELGELLPPLSVVALAAPAEQPSPQHEVTTDTESPPPSTSEEQGESPEAELVREAIGLRRTLVDAEPVAAAELMIRLYGRSPLDAGPLPPVYLALKTFVSLMENGHFELARRLHAAFEAYIAVNQAPGELSSDTSARWKLAREVLETSRLDEYLARALAKALGNDQLFTASDAVEMAYREHGRKLQGFMTVSAPTLWTAIAPLIRSVQSSSGATASTGFRSGGFQWPLRMGGVALFLLVKLFTAFGTDRSPEPRHDLTLSEQRAIEIPKLPALPNPRSGAMPPLLDASAVAQANERQLSGSWASLEAATQIGDCQTVREQWPLYVAALGVATNRDKKLEQTRRRRILEMCSELKELLEESP